jgi:hypothetical protein
MTASTQNLLEDTIVEELGISPTLDEKDALVAMELQYPFQPTTGFEDSPTIPAGTSAESSQVTTTTLQPLEAGIDATLRLSCKKPRRNPETPLEEKKELTPPFQKSAFLQRSYQIRLLTFYK